MTNTDPKIRKTSRAETVRIQKNLDAILQLYASDILTEKQRIKTLRRWVKVHCLILSPETLWKMGIGSSPSSSKSQGLPAKQHEAT